MVYLETYSWARNSWYAIHVISVGFNKCLAYIVVHGKNLDMSKSGTEK